MTPAQHPLLNPLEKNMHGITQLDGNFDNQS